MMYVRLALHFLFYIFSLIYSILLDTKIPLPLLLFYPGLTIQMASFSYRANF